MTSGLRVREGTLADLPELKRLVDSHRDELGFVPRPALAATIKRGWLLVADVDGGIAGAVNWWARKDGVVVLYNLVVSPMARNQGVGRSLLQGLIGWAQAREARKIILKCPEELVANGFYERFGFRLRGHEPGKRRRLNVWELDLRELIQAVMGVSL